VLLSSSYVSLPSTDGATGSDETRPFILVRRARSLVLVPFHSLLRLVHSARTTDIKPVRPINVVCRMESVINPSNFHRSVGPVDQCADRGGGNGFESGQPTVMGPSAGHCRASLVSPDVLHFDAIIRGKNCTVSRVIGRSPPNTVITWSTWSYMALADGRAHLQQQVDTAATATSVTCRRLRVWPSDRVSSGRSPRQQRQCDEGGPACVWQADSQVVLGRQSHITKVMQWPMLHRRL
jgi:hypothetical protein